MGFPVYFDSKNEYFINAEKRKVHSYPLGTAFIDFLELDFLRRDFLNPDILENPFAEKLRYVEDVDAFLEDLKELAPKYRLLVDLVLNSDYEPFQNINSLIRYCIYQNKIPVPDNIKVTYFCSTNGAEFTSPTDLTDLKQLSDTVKELEKLEVTMLEVYEVKCIEDALYISFIKMVTNNIMVKKCKCCDKFFIPGGRSDTEYCNRIAPGSSKTCREIGAIKKYHEKSNNNPIIKEFQKEYKKMNSRVRIKKITQNQFYDWSEKARALRDRAVTENIRLEVFMKLLKELEV